MCCRTNLQSHGRKKNRKSARKIVRASLTDKRRRHDQQSTALSTSCSVTDLLRMK